VKRNNVIIFFKKRWEKIRMRKCEQIINKDFHGNNIKCNSLKDVKQRWHWEEGRYLCSDCWKRSITENLKPEVRT